MDSYISKRKYRCRNIINRYTGDPVKFRFRGDDDVWIFIDGKLVLDVGGVHVRLSGDIEDTGGCRVAASGVRHADTGV